MPLLDRRWFRFRLLWLLLLPVFVGIALTVAYYWPRQAHWLDMREVTGHYHGLGLVDTPGFLGKNYFRIEVRWDGLYVVAELDQYGYNSFRMYYPNGRLAAEGECLVEWNGLHQPMVIIEDIRQGKFYRPDGTLDGEVIDGTGVQRTWTPEGTLTWELHLKNGQRTSASMWYPNGQVSTAVSYVDGEEDGPARSYYPSGQLRCEGERRRGQYVGTWTWYREDGSVDKQETY